MELIELTLEDDERLIGIKSSGRNYEEAIHHSVQFIVGKQNNLLINHNPTCFKDHPMIQRFAAK